MSGFDGLPPVPEEDGFVVAAAVAAVPHGTESVMRGSHRNNRGLHFFAHLIPDRFRFACTPTLDCATVTVDAGVSQG